MSSLDELLDDPSVEVAESVVELDPGAFERRKRAAESRQNRAVSGIVRDRDDRLLLVRRSGADAWDGWLLPGSGVDEVTDFEPRLREELTDLFGDCIADVDPVRIRQHTARRDDGAEGDETSDDETASLFYVQCEVELEGRPVDVVEQSSPGEDTELRWFAETPDEAVNPGVVERILDGGE